MLQLYFYVPESHLTAVLSAIFAAGAGKYENYDQCCWITQGRGQFRPLDNSQPFIGASGKLEYVDEYKVEVIVPESAQQAVLHALKQAHPYEQPAYGFITLL